MLGANNALDACRWPVAAAAFLTLTFIAGPSVAQDKPAAETPAAAAPAAEKAEPAAKVEAKSEAAAEAKPEPKSKGKAKKDKAAKAKPEPKTKPEAAKKAAPAEGKVDSAAKIEADEPKFIEASKLPKPIRDLHKCAGPEDKVELSHEKYAKSVLILATCPTARGALTPTMVYAARAANGAGAKRVTFEMLPLDDKPVNSDVLYSTVPAREAFAMAGDPMPNMHIRNETPWIIGSWRPEDRPGVCAVTATWRIDGQKGQLWFWEEAKECQKDQLPNYEIRIDKKPPPLVGR